MAEAVCAAITGAFYGAAGLGLVAIVPAILAAVAIGCSVWFLCLLALLVAALIVIVATIIGSAVGGTIAQAVVRSERPESSDGAVIFPGAFVTVNGHMEKRDDDNKANVFWWATQTSMHGRATATLRKPFSYCELDDAFPGNCPTPPKAEPLTEEVLV